MLRFGLLVIYWTLFFLLVLFVEALLLTATQRDARRAWLTRSPRPSQDQGRIRGWWHVLTLWWRRFYILAGSALAIIYGLLVGATVTQALDGDLGKFWAVLAGFGISCWVVSCVALMRLLEHDMREPDDGSTAPEPQSVQPD